MIKKITIIVNCVLFVLGIISLLGAISLLVNLMSAAGNSTVVVLDALIILSLLYYFLRKSKYVCVLNNNLLVFFKSHYRVVIAVSLVLIAIWQIILVLNLSGSIGWDPGLIMRGALGIISKKDELYFSYYPNTRFLLYLEHLIYLILGKPTG